MMLERVFSAIYSEPGFLPFFVSQYVSESVQFYTLSGFFNIQPSLFMHNLIDISEIRNSRSVLNQKGGVHNRGAGVP